MKLYLLKTYQYCTYSYSGLSEQYLFIFQDKEKAIKYGEEVLGLHYLENSDLAFDQDSDIHFTVEEDETCD
ncbi:hypothetical protein ICP12012A_018 [Vibrio phage ICP1_2012_A]|uniref:hypothetical protein n=1 Tax=Vibrio cholerae TaxID=666 RepID=UPI000EB6966D|nr:hypothetical protein ICP12012A_018 [Vibrio phage ICP1_2012_A]QVW04520.1 hypothetical protein 2018Mat001_0120 [Vibrio phage ICP1]UPU15536.1 hypothetical protein CJFNICFP_00172 [Vibrio phage VMJ710]WOZ53658.1 hypothetical protein [Vibrio phage VRU]HAT7621003.1 hypothetical protein [Vibrio cholerae O1]